MMISIKDDSNDIRKENELDFDRDNRYKLQLYKKNQVENSDKKVINIKVLKNKFRYKSPNEADENAHENTKKLYILI